MLGGASHVLEESCFVSEVVGPWSSVRKGPPIKSREEGTSRRSRSRSGDGDSARSQLIQICSFLRLSVVPWVLVLLSFLLTSPRSVVYK